MGQSIIMQSSEDAVALCLAGTKTQTRRCMASIWQLGEVPMPDETKRVAIIGPHNQAIWTVGESIGIRPNANSKNAGRVRITALRVENLSDIPDADIIAEAVTPATRQGYFAVWDSINKSDGYHSEDNPKVVVISFVPA